MTAAARQPVDRPAVDADAVRHELGRLLAIRDRAQKLRATLRKAEADEADQARTVAALTPSLSGYVVDGQSVSIHVAPGKQPLVNVRQVVVL